MKPLLLTVLLLRLLAALQTQDALSEDQDMSGTWYMKAMVDDKNFTEGKKPENAFPVVVAALEGGDLEASIPFWKRGQCHNKTIVMKKTDEPGKYTALDGKKSIYIQKLPVKDHYIFYYEDQHQGTPYRKGRLMGRDSSENPEAMEEFKKFVERKGFQQEKIVVPKQSTTHEYCGSCPDTNAALGPPWNTPPLTPTLSYLNSSSSPTSDSK